VELYFGLAARYPEKMLHVPGGSKGGSKKSPVTPPGIAYIQGDPKTEILLDT
jgi:hypothetical protein